MKVSIIIPVYNVEKYLNECIDSLINQTYKNIEILLLDDGSSDKSSVICDEYENIDLRIKTFHNQNIGQGLERNIGIDKSTGDYLMFIDSDDYLKLDTIEKCINKIKENDLDVLYFQKSVLTIDNHFVKEGYDYPSHVCDRQEVIEKLYPRCFGGAERSADPFMIGSAASAIYKKTLITDNDIRFISERQTLNEDALFNAFVCTKANRIGFINEPLYVYRLNIGSTSHYYQANFFDKMIELLDYQLKLNKESLNIAEADLRTKDRLVSNIMVCLKQPFEYKTNITIKKDTILKCFNSSKINEALKDYPVNELPITKRLLIKAVLNNDYLLVYLLLYIKTKIDKKG